MSENVSPVPAQPQGSAPESAPAPAGVVRKKPAPRRATAALGGRRRNGRVKSAAPVLGVHVTDQALYAVLMRPTSDGYEPVRQFTRNRSSVVDGGVDVTPDLAAMGLDAPGATPESLTSADDGVTIQFGDGAGVGGSDLFLESEFAGLNLPDMPTEPGMPITQQTTNPIVFELKDLLEECRAAGFDKPALSFVIGAPDVDYAEIAVPAEGDKKGKADAKGKKGAKSKKSKKASSASSNAPVKRERLIALLPQSNVLYNKDRVAFLPMTPRDNLRRYLAVLPRPEEPVVSSLELLREQQGMRRVAFRNMTAEVPVLIGMARLAFPTEPQENTAIVRVGREDTLVILLQGDQLHHCDHMRSVTTFDGPDTICSRVLLQQDVQGVGTVHNVIVVSEEREDELVQGFAAFYPEARVETLRVGMARAGVAGPYGPLPTQALPAAGTALKTLMKPSPFEDVNLLPKRLRRRGRRMDLSFSWHTAIVGALLFMTVLLFVGLYFKQASEIADAERRLAEVPVQMTMSSGELQMRIDSLRTAQQRIITSLAVLDSLLYGTDRWSQTLATATQASAGVGNVWVEHWEPQGDQLTLSGFATTRDHAVQLAARLNASVDEVLFRDIRDYPVYEYRISYRLPYDLPASVQYLYEQAGESMPSAPPPSEPLAGSIPLGPGEEALIEEELPAGN